MTGSRRPRVLVVAWWYPSPEDPSAGVFVRDHAQAAARDHDVAVIALQAAPVSRPVRLESAVEDGLRTVRVRYGHGRVPAPAAWLTGAGLAYARLRRAGFEPDVVHGHVFMGGLAGALLPRIRPRPLVVSEHFSGFQLGTLRATERIAARAAYRAASAISVPSASLRSALAGYAPPDRVCVVPNPVDTALFHPGGDARSPDVPRILFVGHLEAVKGVGDLLEAARLLVAQDVPFGLDLIGGGADRTRYEGMSADLGLSDRVRFRGPLERAAVADAMREADVLALPSVTETFGTVVVEARACGLPVVATRTGALPELVDETSGKLVPVGDPLTLAAALAAVLREPGRYDAAESARSVAEQYATDAVADRWTEVYASVLRRRSRSGT